MSPRVDVLMPVFNRVGYVEASINSVLAEVGVDARVVLVDDGSTDGTVELLHTLAANNPRIVVIQGNHQGVAIARNIAVSAIAAPFVSFLDSDDLFAPGKLARQIGKLEADPSLAAVIGHRRIFRSESNTPWTIEPPLERKLDICLASATFRRTVFDQLGAFDEELSFGEDLDFYLRIIEADWPIMIETADSVFHRRHKDNMTNDTIGLQKFLIRAHHKSIKRRRAAPGEKVNLFFYQDFESDTVVGRAGKLSPTAAINP